MNIPEEIEKITEYSELITDIVQTTADKLGVESIELNHAVSTLVWEEEQEEIARELFLKLGTSPLTVIEQIEVRGFLALLIGLMGHLRMKREGDVPELSKEKEKEVWEVAAIIKRKLKDLSKP